MKVSRDKLNSKKSDSTDISKPWDKDNQAWWDWYVGLANNEDKKEPVITAEPLPDVLIPTDDEVVSELAKTYPQEMILFLGHLDYLPLQSQNPTPHKFYLNT